MQLLRVSYRVPLDAFYRFNADDGWAIASHIALSTLMSLFPFLILCTALAGFLGSKDLADEVANILLEAWPTQVATPIAAEIHNVLTTARGDLLTIGALLAVYFSSSGIESLRIGLNRAYSTGETRHWYWLRLESIAYVVIGAVGMLALAMLSLAQDGTTTLPLAGAGRAALDRRERRRADGHRLHQGPQGGAGLHGLHLPGGLDGKRDRREADPPDRARDRP